MTEAEGGGVIIYYGSNKSTQDKKSDRRGHAAGHTLCIQLRKCTYLGIGTSSPAKEIWLNPKYHLGGKFTARLSC